MTTAGEFCSRRVVIAKRGESLSDAARRMLEQHVGDVVVVDESERGPARPVGMLTDRDIVVGVLARTDRHIHALTVDDVMSTELVIAREDEPFQDVFERMRSFGVRRVPVVNREDGLEGIITFDHWIEFLEEQITDLATLMTRERKREAEARGGAKPSALAGDDARRYEHNLPLWKYTTARIVTLSQQTDVYSAIRALEDNHIGALLVHDGTTLAGLVTDRDIALRVGSRNVDPKGVLLRDVMTTNLATLPLTATTDDAASLMRERHVRRIPIVQGQRLLGIVTLDDLIVDRAADPATLADIVRAQLSEPARLKDEGPVRPTDPVHGASYTAEF